MKSFIKNLMLLCVVVLLGVSMFGCKGNDKIKVGILKYVSVEALTSAEEGIVEALEEAGFVNGDNIEIIFQNPEANSSLLTNACISLVNECDIIFAIATPAAQAVKAEIENQGKDIPLVFTAVTDPVKAGLVDSNENTTGNVTGTNDMNPVADQVALIKEIDASIAKIGMIYTSSEVNSKVQCDIAEAKADTLGMDVVTQTITSVNDIPNAITALIDSGAKAIYLPTDNIVASAVETVESITTDKGIITICGEEGMVDKGGLITYGINYHKLGFVTGKIGAEIMSGDKTANQIPIIGLETSELALVVNKKIAQASNITIPASILNRASRVVE